MSSYQRERVRLLSGRDRKYMGKYERVSAGTVSILHRIILRQIFRGLAPDLTPGRLKEWWSV